MPAGEMRGGQGTSHELVAWYLLPLGSSACLASLRSAAAKLEEGAAWADSALLVAGLPVGTRAPLSGEGVRGLTVAVVLVAVESIPSEGDLGSWLMPETGKEDQRHPESRVQRHGRRSGMQREPGAARVERSQRCRQRTHPPQSSWPHGSEDTPHGEAGPAPQSQAYEYPGRAACRVPPDPRVEEKTRQGPECLMRQRKAEADRHGYGTADVSYGIRRPAQQLPHSREGKLRSVCGINAA